MDSKLWTVCFVTVSVCCFLVIGLSDEQRSAAWLQSISLMNQHKSPSKSFPTVSSFPISPHLPSLTERPEAKHRGNGAAKHIAHGFGFGDNRSRDPCRALQLLHTHTHIHSPLSTYLGRMGKAHSVPPGRTEATGTAIPQSYTPLFLHLFFFSFPCRLRSAHVIRQTASCCITHTPLCPCLPCLKPCSLM